MTAAELVKSLSTVTSGTAEAVVSGIYIIRQLFTGVTAALVNTTSYECNLTTVGITADMVDYEVEADCTSSTPTASLTSLEFDADIKDEHGTI